MFIVKPHAALVEEAMPLHIALLSTTAVLTLSLLGTVSCLICLAVFISNYTVVFLMIQKNRKALTAKRLIIIAVAPVMMMTSVSVASMASAQQPQTSGSKSGTIASLQNGKNGKPEWILSGGWDFKNINSSSPALTAHSIW